MRCVPTREKGQKVQPVDLLEAATSLARSLFYLEDQVRVYQGEGTEGRYSWWTFWRLPPAWLGPTSTSRTRYLRGFTSWTRIRRYLYFTLSRPGLQVSTGNVCSGSTLVFALQEVPTGRYLVPYVTLL